MAKSSKPARRTVGACVCLLATVLLYAPLAAAAWTMQSMSCCAGEYCPLHRQSHQKTQEHEMDCGHDHSGMAACSMDCCHIPEKAALSLLTFVLPRPESVSKAQVIAHFVNFSDTNEIRPFSKPLSPPPRVTAAIL